MDKIITNPVTGEKVTFLKESHETNGEYTKIKVELVPYAKGVPKHYHTAFTETFEIIEGEVLFKLGQEKKLLKKGEKVFVPIGQVHTFRNDSDKPVKFTVEIKPASVGFERSLRMLFGLARDGGCRKNGMPIKFAHLALLAKWGEGMPPGILNYLMPIMDRAATKAEKNGIAQELIDKYCS